ncbi:MAG: SDR family oxidoreductase [Gemmatimonadota bacterium]|nr:MAG: SDR family oxidoreductase [Gemmatimonadota bacterium]
MGLIDLTGKVALVTGGSRGIGAATAKMLATAGAGVAITYRTRRSSAESVLAGLSRSDTGRPPIAIQADVSSCEDCERAVDETVAAFGRLDCFVANAGIWPPDEVPLTEMSDDQWRTTMSVNLDSIFYGCRAALRAMQASAATTNDRSIVIVSSTAAQRGEGFHADYAATKGAVNSFVKSLAVEAAPDVRVNAVAPGWVDTEMCELPFASEGGRGRSQIEAGIPMRRVASAADVAGPIVFLCSQLARHVTGEILNVNGGSVLCG